MRAAGFSRQSNKMPYQWKIIEGVGYTRKALQAFPLSIAGNVLTDARSFKGSNAVVEYDFYTFSRATRVVTVFTLPTHPINNNCSLRYAVSVDNEPATIVDFKTTGRSLEWKENVLRNRAERKIMFPFLDAGKHTLKIYAIDPGVILDEIHIDLGDLIKAYGTIPETRIFQVHH